MEIKIFVRENGKNPVLEFISKLNSHDQHKIKRILLLFQKYGLQKLIQTNQIKKVVKKHKIYELRPGKHRIMFTELGATYWLLNGFAKKTNKTPKNEIDKAVNTKKLLLNLLNKR